MGDTLADTFVSTGLHIGNLQGFFVMCVSLLSPAILFRWLYVSKAFSGGRCTTVPEDVCEKRHSGLPRSGSISPYTALHLHVKFSSSSLSGTHPICLVRNFLPMQSERLSFHITFRNTERSTV